MESTQDISEAQKKNDRWVVGPESQQRPLLSVILPSINEEEGIRECIERIKTAAGTLEVPTEIIVSDNSTDRTPDIAAELGANVVTPDKLGYGYAYRYGFQYARGEYIVIGDADTTYDFKEIPRLLKHLLATDADIVMGSRLDGEIKPGAMPALHRYVGNPLLTRFMNTFYDTDVTDSHSGFRIFKRNVIEELGFEGDGMEFASEMLIRAAESDLSISEVPITYHKRTGEATLESFRDGWRHVRFMLANAPGYLFTAPALGFGAVGILSLLLSLIGGEFLGLYFGVQTAIVGSMMMILGFQVGSLAVYSSVSAQAIRPPNDRVTTWIRENVRLEHGMLAGLTMFVTATLYFVGVSVWWFATNGTFQPSILLNIIAFTGIVLGMQAVFSVFFLNSISSTGTSSGDGDELDLPKGNKISDNQPLSKDDVYGLLSEKRRRTVLEYLAENGGNTTLSGLAEYIAAQENDIDIAQVSSKQRKRVYVALYQTHLPRMDELGVIDFDSSRGTVELGPTAAQLSNLMELKLDGLEGDEQ